MSETVDAEIELSVVRGVVDIDADVVRAVVDTPSSSDRMSAVDADHQALEMKVQKMKYTDGFNMHKLKARSKEIRMMSDRKAEKAFEKEVFSEMQGRATTLQYFQLCALCHALRHTAWTVTRVFADTRVRRSQ